jgi:hypothetical protein
MGFLASAATVTITAKLTPFGRQRLLAESSSIITQFSLGDSDANYVGSLPLDRGKVPALAGEIGTNNLFSNGCYLDVNVDSNIIVNGFGETKKPIQTGSNEVVITPKFIGVTGLTGTTITELIIDRTLGDTDGNTNLFHSFGLPIIQADKNLYASIPTSLGGYSDTAIRNLNKDRVLVMAIDKCTYGEIIDGKTVHVKVETTGATEYNLYSTFQKSAITPLTTYDNQVKEILNLGVALRTNAVLLFSDEVQKPNGDASKSWATGYGLSRPFSLNNKELFNPVSNVFTSTSMDHAVGVAYLDKGIVVITHPDIVDNYDPIAASATTEVTFNSISNEVAQNITCIVERDEFASTQNNTHTDGDLIRVSEVALYDAFNNVIAFGKSNEHIIIGANQYMALGVRILV